MRSTSLFLLPLVAGSASAAIIARTAASSCSKIEAAISSSSAVFYPGSDDFVEDNEHFVETATQNATCAVEPGTTDDLAKILSILAADNTPFGIKGGGHAFNVGFSSTLGVQIATKRFNSISYDATTQRATFGSGVVFDDVYQFLEPYGRNVLGGRISGVGVAGFILGGGYAWNTNQYGLAIDSVVEFEILLPNGQLVKANAATNSDLFWGLKGGYNNFGVVTKITMNTQPQPQVWAGRRLIADAYSSQVIEAAAAFMSTNTDAKAGLLVSFLWLNGAAYTTLLFNYNDATPSDVYDDLLAIPYISSTLDTRSFYETLLAAPSLTEIRGGHDTVPILENSEEVLTAIREQVIYWGQQMSAVDSGFHTTIAAEPFVSDILTKSGAGASSSAYPPSRAQMYTPSSIDFGWVDPSKDAQMFAAMKQATANLTATVRALGQAVDDGAPYGNYAYLDVPVEKIFGAALPQLKQVKAKYDPNNVMGLTGGWKITA